MDNPVDQNRKVPKTIRGVLPYLYSKNLPFAPTNFYDPFEKIVLKKFENGRFYRKNESVLLPFFIFKSLGLKTKINDHNKEKLIRILRSELSDMQISLLAKGYFYHAFSRLEQYDRDIISIAQERIKENPSTSFLSLYLTPESLKLNFTYNKIQPFSKALKKLGRGLIGESSLFSKALWDIYVNNTGSTVHHFITNFKISELTSFLEDLLCSDKGKIRLRGNEEETNRVLTTTRNYLLENHTLLSNKDIAFLTDFFLSIGAKSCFDMEEKLTNILEKRSSQEWCLSESIDILSNRLIKSLSENNQQKFFLFLKKLAQSENFEVSFCVKEESNFKYLEEQPFEAKTFPTNDKSKEPIIVIYRTNSGYLAIFPQSKIIKYRKASLGVGTTLPLEYFDKFLTVEIGNNYPWDKQIEKYFEPDIQEIVIATVKDQAGKIWDFIGRNLFRKK